jgi:hypothetical protein
MRELLKKVWRVLVEAWADSAEPYYLIFDDPSLDPEPADWHYEVDHKPVD